LGSTPRRMVRSTVSSNFAYFAFCRSGTASTNRYGRGSTSARAFTRFLESFLAIFPRLPPLGSCSLRAWFSTGLNLVLRHSYKYAFLGGNRQAVFTTEASALHLTLMSSVLLQFKKEDELSVKFASEYWECDKDGAWLHTVKNISERWQYPVHQIARLVEDIAIAFHPEVECAICKKPMEIASRADYKAALERYRPTCRRCEEHAEARQKSEAEEQVKSINEARNKIWLQQTSRHRPYDYGRLSYVEAMLAFSLYIGSELNEETGEFRLSESPSFGPSKEDLWNTLSKFHDAEILEFGENTPLNAFDPGTDPSTFSYYYARVSWQFALPETTRSFSSLFREISGVVDLREEDESYHEAVSEIWWQIGFSDAQRHLDKELEKYGLSIQSGDKLREAFRYALSNFSIPQVRNLIWRVVKNAAAYSAQKGIYKQQAVNTIPNALIKLCDRALASSWIINPFIQKWDEEECVLTTVLFDRVLESGEVGFKFLTGKSVDAATELPTNTKSSPSPAQNRK
jgi:hypothetical protein